MFEEYLKSVLECCYGIDINECRPFVKEALKEIEEKWKDKNIFIIEAPTGYGKSSISFTLALFSCEEEFKSIISYPLRALLEDQFERIKALSDNVGKRYMHNPDSRYLIKPITLTTIDTLSLTLFGLSPDELNKILKGYNGTSAKTLGHYLFSTASVLLSNIILDEVHLLADTTKSLNFLIYLIEIAKEYDTKLVLMTATLPESLIEILNKAARDKGEIIRFKENSDINFVQKQFNKEYKILLSKPNNRITSKNKFQKLESILNENKDKFKRALVIFNTVSDAVEFYERIKNRYDSILIHSRFTEKDRDAKVRELKNKKVIVSTQVIEAGVDISSDLLITEICPANSLIQRFGRFLRYDNENKGKIYIWYEIDENGELLRENDRYKVYDYELTKKTLEWLRNNKNNLLIRIPFKYGGKLGYKELLDDVYDKYEINENLIKEFIKVMMNPELQSMEALRLLEKLEGSYIRDEILIPVIAREYNGRNISKESVMEIDLYKFLEEYVVPISSRTFKSDKVKILKEVIYDEDSNKIYLQDIKDPDEFKDKIRKMLGIRLIRDMVRRGVVAYLIDAEYDSEYGLRW